MQRVLLTAAVLAAMASTCVNQEVPGLAYMEILKTSPRREGSMAPSALESNEASVRYDVMLDYDFYPFDEGSEEAHLKEDLLEEVEPVLISTAIERPPSTDTTPVITSERRENTSSVTTMGVLDRLVKVPEGMELHPSGTQMRKEEEESPPSVTLRSRSSEAEVLDPSVVTIEGATSQSAEESVRFVNAVQASPHSKDAVREKHSLEGSAEIPLARIRQASPRYIYPKPYYPSDYAPYLYSPTSGNYAPGQYPESIYLHSGNPGSYQPVDEYSPSYYPTASYSNGYTAPPPSLPGYPAGYHSAGSYPSYSIPRIGYIPSPYDTAGYLVGKGYYYPREGDSSKRYISRPTGDEVAYEDSIERAFSVESSDQNKLPQYEHTGAMNGKYDISEEVQSSTSTRRQATYVPNHYITRDNNSQRPPVRLSVFKTKQENTPGSQATPTRASVKLPAGVKKKDVAAVRYYTGLQREIERSDLLSDAIKDVRTRDGKSIKDIRRSTTTTTATPVPDIRKIKKSFGTHPLYRNLPHSSSPETEAGPIVHKDKYDDEDDEYDNLYLPVRAKSLELEEIREVKEHFNILVPKTAYKPQPFSETPPYPGQGIYIPPVTTFRPYEIPKYNKNLKPLSVPGERYDSFSQLERPYRYQRPTYSDSLKYYRPHDSSDSKAITPKPYYRPTVKPYYQPTSKPYILTTPRPYYPLTSRPKVQPIESPYVPPVPKSHFPLISTPHVSPKPKSRLPPTKYVPSGPQVLLTSRHKIAVTSKPRLIISSRPKITVTSKPRPKAPATPKPYPRPSPTPYPRPTSTSKPRAIKFPKSLDAPASRTPVEGHPKPPSSFTPRDKTPHSRGHARVPSSILREQGQGSPALEEKVREKRRPDMETQIDSTIRFPKYGYNIDHYFQDFPAFGYFNLDQKGH